MEHVVVVGGWSFLYYASGESIPEHYLSGLVRFDAEVDEQLKEHPRVRRVLTVLYKNDPLTSPRFYDALHCSDGTDLDELDRAVIAGQYTDDDFASFLLADHQGLTCLACRASIPVLYCDLARPPFSNDVKERVGRHLFKDSCPACGASFRGAPVVEFLSPYADV